MENRDLQGSWGGATVRQDYAMMMMSKLTTWEVQLHTTSLHLRNSDILRPGPNWGRALRPYAPRAKNKSRRLCQCPPYISVVARCVIHLICVGLHWQMKACKPLSSGHNVFSDFLGFRWKYKLQTHRLCIEDFHQMKSNLFDDRIFQP